jgi:hypothetical protein
MGLICGNLGEPCDWLFYSSRLHRLWRPFQTFFLILLFSFIQRSNQFPLILLVTGTVQTLDEQPMKNRINGATAASKILYVSPTGSGSSCSSGTPCDLARGLKDVILSFLVVKHVSAFPVALSGTVGFHLGVDSVPKLIKLSNSRFRRAKKSACFQELTLSAIWSRTSLERRPLPSSFAALWAAMALINVLPSQLTGNVCSLHVALFSYETCDKIL